MTDAFFGFGYINEYIFVLIIAGSIEQSQEGSSIRVDSPTSQHVATLTKIDGCQCVTLLSGLYPQLVRHWQSTGSINKTIHYLLEASTVSMSDKNNILVSNQIIRVVVSLSLFVHMCVC